MTPDNKLDVKEETRKIPLIPDRDRLLFGFIVIRKGGGNFNGQLTVDLPAHPKQLTGHVKDGHIMDNTISFPTSQHDNYWTQSFWFGEGDPSGIWRYKIFINGKLYTAVEF